MKVVNLFGRLIITFEGKDWGTGLAQYINGKIKEMPKADRKFMFQTKAWSLPLTHEHAIKTWQDMFWRDYRAKKFARDTIKGNMVIANNEADDFLKQFDDN